MDGEVTRYFCFSDQSIPYRIPGCKGTDEMVAYQVVRIGGDSAVRSRSLRKPGAEGDARLDGVSFVN